MPKYERGDYVKVEFESEAGWPGEWMWVRVRECDDERQLVFGILDSEPVTWVTVPALTHFRLMATNFLS